MTTDEINQCQCKADGYCVRYDREMRGRWREICCGVNVDLGTAAVFRAQWDREAAARRAPVGGPRHLILKADQAPGDMVAMTAAIYSLHRAHPGKYLTAVECLHPQVFDHNPDVVPAALTVNPALLQMHYPSIHQCNDRAIHFMQGWCEHLESALGVRVPLLTNRPRLYFDTPQPDVGNFWVVCSGGKRDFTAKLWGHNNYQEVVCVLRDQVQFVQVGVRGDDHRHLSYAYDMLGAHSLRGLFDLVRRCRGVLCGVSLLMHVAAAMQKPAVVIAGGREPVAWNSYPRQQYLHTIGALPCRSTQGHTGEACWRSRVLPLGDGSAWDRDTCERPQDGIPACMRLISPASVAELILRYDRQYETHALSGLPEV